MKHITMTKLLQNPSGPYSAYFARRDLVIQNLTSRFQKLLTVHKDFKHEIYRDKDDFIFYFKIPSEKFETVLYDVVIKFTPHEESSIGDMTLNNYSVMLFSNSPNFIFTYAYMYNQDGIIIPELKDKINSKALTQEAVVKNPLNSYGFEKSVYFALLYIKSFRLNVKSNILSKAGKPEWDKLYKAVKSSDLKLKEYNRLKANEQTLKQNQKSEKKVAKVAKTSYNRKGSSPSSARKNSSDKPLDRKKSMTHSMKHDMNAKTAKKLSSRTRRK